MDPVSEILDRIRVESTAYFGKNLNTTWGMDVDEDSEFCRLHMVMTGSTWVGFQESDTCLQLNKGDLAIIPNGRAHFLDDEPGRLPRSAHHIPDPAGKDVRVFEPLIRERNNTHVLCSYFRFVPEFPALVRSKLPPIFVVRTNDKGNSSQQKHIMDLLKLELSKPEQASQAVLNRLTDIMLIHALKNWVKEETRPGKSLYSLVDPKLEQVFAQIHDDPKESWTVDALALISGQSRTVFSAYFKQSTGMTPIAYITQCRMEKAADYLAKSELSLDEIAIEIGYNDTSAFSRAFKRATGKSPNKYRSENRSYSGQL